MDIYVCPDKRGTYNLYVQKNELLIAYSGLTHYMVKYINDNKDLNIDLKSFIETEVDLKRLI